MQSHGSTGRGRATDLGSLLKEARDDVRSYGTVLVQLVLLILTTMSLAAGWVAKDYLGAMYRIAKSQQPVPNGGDLSAYVRCETAALELLMHSPTTTLFLLGTCFFAALLMGLMVVMFYMLQRRRFWSHDIAQKLGAPRDTPVIDPVLTSTSVAVLLATVAIPAVLAYYLALAQMAFCLPLDLPLSWEVGLWVMVAVVSVKMYCTACLYCNFSDWEREIGWELRWPRALELAQSLQEAATKVEGRTELPPEVHERCAEILAACQHALGPERSRLARGRIWDSQVNPTLQQLVLSVNYDERNWSRLGEEVMALAYTLRVVKGLRYNAYRRTARFYLFWWRVSWGVRRYMRS